jgi:hypothetical protein
MPQTATKANVGALVPAVIVLVSYIVGRWTGTIALPSDAELSGAIIAIITAAVSYGMGWLAIYLPANKPVDSAGNRMRSHPVATLFAFALALLFLGGGLAGSASVGVGRDATVQQRVDAARVDLATASLFVDLYATFPRCGAGVPQPCSNQNVVALLVKGRIAADAALDAVDALIAAGSPTEQILVALLEAQKAVRLVENLRANAAAAHV